jgi:hypothetical protein
MSIISHLLSIRTSTCLTRNILRSTRLFSSTLPSSDKKNTTNNILPNELPLVEKKKAKYNISWKSKSCRLDIRNYLDVFRKDVTCIFLAIVFLEF